MMPRTVSRFLPMLVSVVSAFILSCSPGLPPEPEPEDSGNVKIRPIVYKELDQTIQSHKGKVVLIEFWKFD